MKTPTKQETDILVTPVAVIATLLDHFARFMPERDPCEVLAYVSECAAEWRAQRGDDASWIARQLLNGNREKNFLPRKG